MKAEGRERERERERERSILPPPIEVENECCITLVVCTMGLPEKG